jgi:hypothetical protein
MDIIVQASARTSVASERIRAANVISKVRSHLFAVISSSMHKQRLAPKRYKANAFLRFFLVALLFT